MSNSVVIVFIFAMLLFSVTKPVLLREIFLEEKGYFIGDVSGFWDGKLNPAAFLLAVGMSTLFFFLSVVSFFVSISGFRR